IHYAKSRRTLRKNNTYLSAIFCRMAVCSVVHLEQQLAPGTHQSRMVGLRNERVTIWHIIADHLRVGRKAIPDSKEAFVLLCHGRFGTRFRHNGVAGRKIFKKSAAWSAREHQC